MYSLNINGKDNKTLDFHIKVQFLDLPSISVRKDGISPSEEVYASIAPSNHERDWSPSKGHRGLRARFLESQGLPKDKRGNIRI